MTRAEHAGDRLVSRIDAAGTPVCVGLDPDVDRLPEPVWSGWGCDIEAVEAFCVGVVEAVAGVVPAVKPQSACFERFGHAGVRVLEAVCRRARDAGLVVVLDAKRGDIGVSARHYAAMAADLGADWITVNAYLGMETLEPYLEAGLGIFALVRTSNPGSDGLQGARLAGGETVAERVAGELAVLGSGWVGASGVSSVGAVVGATKGGDECRRLRGLMPGAPVLVPGVGAQGGTMEDVRPLCRAGARTAGGLGVLVNASRSVLYPGGGGDWQGRVREAAEGFAGEGRGLV